MYTVSWSCSKSTKMHKRILIASLVLCMLLCGCGRLFPDRDNGGDPAASDVLIRIGSDTCSVYEAMIFISSQREFYEGGYGPDIWSVRLDPSGFDTYLMDGIKTHIGLYFAGSELAESRGVSLTPEEDDAAAEAAARYLKASGSTDLTAKEVEEVFKRYHLAIKGYEYIVGQDDIEISEDEARVIRLQQIRMLTGGLTDQQAGEKLDKLNEIYDLAAVQGSDFASLAAQYNEASATELRVSRDDLPAGEEKAAFELGTGEISPVTQTSDGYVIFKCLSSNEKDASAARRSQMIEDIREETYRSDLIAFLGNNPMSWNEAIWDSLKITEVDYTDGVSFYDIYKECFIQ